MKKILFVTAILASSLYRPAPAHDLDKIPGGFPLVDTLELELFRARLDSIRKIRPTVALVLSGGGAKGAAHVGVMKHIDSLGIPVDLIVGTSIGGLVGGLYAVGYTTGQVEHIVGTMDWDAALSDRVPRNYMTISEHKYHEKYALSFPFYYSKKDMLTKKDKRYDESQNLYDELHFGAEEEDEDYIEETVMKNVLGLPSGYIFGQNVSNIFSSLTAGYQDNICFNDLPVPFICVAADMVTGKAKIWTSGKLNTALRSTMSIPAVFAPVKEDGMVLVDGGIRDNYPADIAKYLGADYIIGVDLSGGFRGYNDINNLLDIISQTTDMLGRESYEENLHIPTVTVKPNLDGYNMMSFNTESIDSIMRRGYVAALAQDSLLRELKNNIGSVETPVKRRSATDLENSKVLVSGMEITGVTRSESIYLMKMLKLDLPEELGREELQDAVATLYGTTSFDYVTYELLGEEEPFKLRINCKRGPANQLGMGFRIDSQELISILLNVGWNTHKLQGSALEFSGKLSVSPYIDLHYYNSSSRRPTLNARVKYHYVGRDRIGLDYSDLSLDYRYLKEEIYLSHMNWSMFDLQGGIRNEFFKFGSSPFNNNPDILTYNSNELKNSYLSFFFNGFAETFDNGYFPTNGYSINLNYSWVFKGLQTPITAFHLLSFSSKNVVRIGRRFAFLPSVNARFMLKGERNVYIPYCNTVGGNIAGLYLDQTFPFLGANNIYALDNMMIMLRGDFRVRIAKNNYITAGINALEAGSSMDDLLIPNNCDYYIGGGIEYAYNSIVGPLKAIIQWSNLSKKTGVYLSLGFDF